MLCLQGDDLVWLVEYLDEVYLAMSPFRIHRSVQHGLLVIATPPFTLSGSVCANSEVYTAIGLSSQHRTHPHRSRSVRLKFPCTLTIQLPLNITYIHNRRELPVQRNMLNRQIQRIGPIENRANDTSDALNFNINTVVHF